MASELRSPNTLIEPTSAGEVQEIQLSFYYIGDSWDLTFEVVSVQIFYKTSM